MLQDLDSTLTAFLQQELPQDLLAQISISFATPDNDFVTKTLNPPALNLFLYSIQENLEFRSSGWQTERQNGTAIRTPFPLRVDCSYLVTAWPGDVPNPEQEEHYLLGEVMKVLMRYRQLPSEVIQGSLAGQDPAVRVLGLRPPQLQSIGEFWQAMGGKPKAALNYTVTIAVPVSEPSEPMPVAESGVDIRLSTK